MTLPRQFPDIRSYPEMCAAVEGISFRPLESSRVHTAGPILEYRVTLLGILESSMFDHGVNQIIKNLEAENVSLLGKSKSEDFELATELDRVRRRLIERQARYVFPRIASAEERSIADWYFFFSELKHQACGTWNDWRRRNPEAIIDFTE